MRQGGRFYRAAIPKATPPEELAEIIGEALTQKQPRLRWLHGYGASLVEQRPNIPDEEYISMTELDDGSYDARFEEFFDIDLSGKATDTVNRWILEQTERIPNNGETFEFEGLKVMVKTASQRRIGEVVIGRKEPMVEEGIRVIE